MAPKFIFLRHGEATHNVAFHVEGAAAFKNEANRDARLTEKGVEQAKAAAEALSSLKIRAIWSSPLTRAIQTAIEVFEQVDCHQLCLHDNLLERLGNGHVMNERKPKKELKEAYPSWNVSYMPERPCFWEEYENDYALRQRMFMIIMLIADIYQDIPESQHILIVGHSDAIKSLTGRCLKNAEHVIFTLDELKNL